MTARGFESIGSLVEAYYQGMYAADDGLLRRAFDAAARVRGFFADRYVETDLDQFISRLTAGPSAQSLGQPYHLEILNTLTDGRIATVVVRDSLHGMTFVDHLSLVEGDGGWRIAGKIYTTPAPLAARQG